MWDLAVSSNTHLFMVFNGFFVEFPHFGHMFTCSQEDVSVFHFPLSECPLYHGVCCFFWLAEHGALSRRYLQLVGRAPSWVQRNFLAWFGSLARGMLQEEAIFSLAVGDFSLDLRGLWCFNDSIVCSLKSEFLVSSRTLGFFRSSRWNFLFQLHPQKCLRWGNSM